MEHVNVDKKEFYKLLHSYVHQSEQTTWSRFNNYLLFNSIMIMTWAMIYVKTPHDQFDNIILFGICIMGIISGIFWFGLGYRGRKFMFMFVEKGVDFEMMNFNRKIDLFKFIQTTRDSLRCRWAGSFYILMIGPILVSLFYVFLSVLLILSYC